MERENMKKKIKVLLLGDSIRMGYEEYVKQGLGSNFETIYPEDNGRDVSTTLWQANQVFKNNEFFDVIHWNNGYWDMNIESPMTEAFHPVDEYQHFLVRMVKFFSQHTRKLVFANSLPVMDTGLDDTKTGLIITYDNECITKYNKAAEKVMKEFNIPINDLYQFVLKDHNYYKNVDKLHLTDEGNRAVAKEVIKAILE